MNLESNTLQDLCYHFTWQLTLMLSGAWMLGLLFWYGWWLQRRKKYALETKRWKKESLEKGNHIAQLENIIRELKISNEQNHNNLKALQTSYGNLVLQKKLLEEDNENLMVQLFAAEEELETMDENEPASQEEENGSQETDGTQDLLSGENQKEPPFGRPEEAAGYAFDNQPEAVPSESETLEYNKFFDQLSNDDLKIFEGIGPKLESILKANGIQSWKDLSGCRSGDLQNILNEAGPHYRLHNPLTWAEQAQLAVNGRWEELAALQQGLSLQKDHPAQGQSKIEKIIAKLMGFSKKPGDLKIVEGIGPKIEQLLKEAGIDNWARLAETEVSELQRILLEAGPRFRIHNPDTWPEQARLALAREWDRLKDFQDNLTRRK